jgi:hypothetical protein
MTIQTELELFEKEDRTVIVIRSSQDIDFVVDLLERIRIDGIKNDAGQV